jgi:pilus assembly protein CpaD
MPLTSIGCCRVNLLLAWMLTQLAACAAMVPPPPSTPVAEPTAARVETDHRVLFDSDADEPSAIELERLDVFLAGLPPDAVPDFRVIGGSGWHSTGSFNPDLHARRADVLARHIRQRAAPAASVSIAVPTHQALVVPGFDEPFGALARSVEIVATTYSVRLPECPDWTRSPSFDPRNLPLSNLGCANAVNIGLMVADPADLAEGRQLGTADGIREAEAVVRYRTDKVKELKAGMTKE